MDQKGLEISWASLWRVLFVILLATILFIARDILVALFLAIVISSALDPLVTWMEKRGLPRIIGTLGLYILIIFFLALVAYAVVPTVLSELSTFLSSLGKKSGTAFDFLDTAGLIDSINKALGKITNLLLSGSTSIFEVGTRFLGGLTAAISVFVLSFYLTVGKDGVEKFFVAILPSAYESKITDLYTKIKRKMGNWLAGQIGLSFAVGLLTFIGLTILGVRYSLLLGILAGIFELVPYVGPIFSGAIAVMVGLITSTTTAFYVLLLFIIIQQMENHVLVPAVNRLTTDLEPVVVLIALLIGAQVFGVIGLILAVPAAVLLQEVVNDWSASKARRRGLGL